MTAAVQGSDFVADQIAKTWSASQNHNDEEARQRAEVKYQKWLQTFVGMIQGKLKIGSRTPRKDTPAWATLEVLWGGFASGNLEAGGPLRNHEKLKLKQLGLKSKDGRQALHRYYLSEPGVSELQHLLHSGCYRVDVPEEAALLTAVWLNQQGQAEQALELLQEISPWMQQLRFYPRPVDQPQRQDDCVALQTVEQARDSLKQIRAPLEIHKQQETLLVWNPLVDRLVSLFLETVEGPTPFLTDQKPKRSNDRQKVDGGWPCQNYPRTWKARAKELLAEAKKLRVSYRLCGKPNKAQGSLSLLLGYLETCVKDPRSLTGAEVSLLRGLLAGIVAKRGLPDSPRLQQLREMQTRQARLPDHQQFAKVLLARLKPHTADEGLDQPEDLCVPLTAKEASRLKTDAGAGLPSALLNRVRRCLRAPVEQLLERGLIPSSETLATVVPQLSSNVCGEGFNDPQLRRLYVSLHQAFHRRRSLLLLNLESQVKLRELPWAAAILQRRTQEAGPRQNSQRVLRRVVESALTAFPQTILPNRLLQELRLLAEAAELRLPIVDELAADIFMGEFSVKFHRAAEAAADLLEGSLYERYYEIDYAEVRRLAGKLRSNARRAPDFAKVCRRRAGDPKTQWSVAGNGKIIEQSQILTTQNLAVLCAALELQLPWESLAKRCWDWILHECQLPAAHHRVRLHRVKNAAYAWRQLVFYASLLSPDAATRLLGEMQETTDQQPKPWRARFGTLLSGLKRAAEGKPRVRIESSKTRYLLGWTTKKHWLIVD